MNRDELLAKLKKPSRRYTEVTVPSGDTYTIQSLTLREKGENDILLANKKGEVDLGNLPRQKGDLLCRSIVDEHKKPILTPEDWEVWQDVDAGDTTVLLDAIQELNDTPVKGMVGNSRKTGG